ncbi:MAG: Tn3 family transposase [Desulfamplus sp.]|nr:Tn3 family transposase [Desulfamplus sp.]
MKRNWTEEELYTHWYLLPLEKNLLINKHQANRLGFALFFKFFQLEGRFPTSTREIPRSVVQFMVIQVGGSFEHWSTYPWDGATITRHRIEIRKWFGFREITLADQESFKCWLIEEIIPNEHREDRLREVLLQRCRDLKIEPPVSVHRLIQSALQEHEIKFCDEIFHQLSPDTLVNLDKLLQPSLSEENEADRTNWQYLKEEPGKAGIASVKSAASRLNVLREIKLLPDLFKAFPPKLPKRYARQAAVKEPFELRRHAGPLRVTLMAAFLLRRSEYLTDHLVDLLVETVHKMSKKAECKVADGMGEGIHKASSKMIKLYEIAKASIEKPKGVVAEVVFPAASEQWLLSFIQEVESGSAYKGKVKATLQSSYRSHYRQMLPYLLNNLEFRSTNSIHQPVMKALNVLRSNLEYKGVTYPVSLNLPLKGVVAPAWMPLVLEDEGIPPKINRIAYEICVLKSLRERLRYREIWVVGGRRYRNPEEDLPQDFEERRTIYYDELGIPFDAKVFSTALREELTGHLEKLNKEIPVNPKVSIVAKKDVYRISISPSEPQSEPENLKSLKKEIIQRWAGTSLLDVLKETDLRVNFTQFLKSETERTHMEQATLQRRLLLCLFGMGTNTGIKSMGFQSEDDYKDLLYIRRRFISKDSLRQAITQVVNATLAVRLQQFWGESTTACASDSKQFGAWDQNLLTEWHLRYGGRGVMVYWHVAKNATCIYSQFKRVSSSEVAAMIQGVLRHCTEMEVDRQYVDTHGQSTVGFAFCRLLGFELMPRLKGISRQKLYKADLEQSFPNIDPIMALKAINWELIETQLDAMVQHVVALKMGMTDAESILRRFTRNNGHNLVYKAFVETGKVIKTIFLCRYLGSEELRREIHQGLNVVESWNSTNDFICYGRHGELSSNRQEDQEIGLLCLHLLQASLVYINTLMIQQVLGEPEWDGRMKPRDLSALSPLLTQHITPYGRFDLDMNVRLKLGD